MFSQADWLFISNHHVYDGENVWERVVAPAIFENYTSLIQI